MRLRKRFAVLETAVLAMALLLAAFVAQELWRRRASPPDSGAEAAATAPAAYQGARGPAARPRTSEVELGVAAAPPLKLTRWQRRKPTPKPVPAPR